MTVEASEDQIKREMEVQEASDSVRICLALKSVMEKHGLSSAELARRTHTSAQNVQRMMRYQEPKASWLARAERVMGTPLGTVLAEAKMIESQTTPEAALAVDPRLHPIFQRSAPEMVLTWIALSEAEFERDSAKGSN